MTIDELHQRLSDLDYLSIIGPLAGILPKRLSDPSIFVDGGESLRPPEMANSLSIGDGDSSSPEKMDLLLPEEKDVSDLGFVLSHLPPGIDHVELTGFFGRRLDHQLANLGVVHDFLLNGPAIVSFDETRSGWGLPADKSVSLMIQGPFSLFSLQPGHVEMRGQIKYELGRETVLAPLSSRGLSNNGLGEFTISSSVPVFVLPTTED